MSQIHRDGDPFPGKWVTLVLKKLETAPIRQRSSTLRKTYEVLAPIIHERSWRPTHIPMAEESGDVRARRYYEEAGHRGIRPGVMQLHLVDGVEQRRVLKKQRWHAGDLVVWRTRRHRLLCG